MGLLSPVGCTGITAVNLNDASAPQGIPYYLPKPYLFVSKNVRYIPTLTVGLTEVATAPPASTGAGGGNGDGTANGTGTGTGNGNGTGAGNGTGSGSKTKSNGANSTPSTPPDNSQPAGASDQAIGPASASLTSGNNLDADPFADPNVLRYANLAGQAVLASATLPPGGVAEAGADAAGKPKDGPTTQSDQKPPTNDQTSPQNPTNPTTPAGGSQISEFPSTVVPAASIPDEMHPQMFFTYQIIYLPDLTQKYGLRVSGGAGEMRQTMNLVNGWMYTGGGPMYFNDSTVAQDITAVGSAVGAVAGDVAKAVVPTAALTGATAAKPAGQQTAAVPTSKFDDYAQLWVYELDMQVDPHNPKAMHVCWRLMKGFPLIVPREYSSISSESSDSTDQNQNQNQKGNTQAAKWDDNSLALLGKNLATKSFNAVGITYLIQNAQFQADVLHVTLTPNPSAAEQVAVKNAVFNLVNNEAPNVAKKTSPPVADVGHVVLDSPPQ
jgi:hypothetical protein